MPELPEVETVCQGLSPVLTGQRIARVELKRPDLRFPLPERFAERLRGRTVTKITRRAKYILAHLDDGHVLAMHLGMTGRFSVAPVGRAEDLQLGDYVYEHGGDSRHDHVVFTLKNGAIVTYNDARRFGYMTLLPAATLDVDPFFANLGVEPLSDALSPAYVAAKAKGRKTDLKAFLMDQRIIAGLGNIYVCEALHRARLSPRRKASTLATRAGAPLPRAETRVEAIRAVLHEAIEAGGSSLRDHRRTDGELGDFQHDFRVYDRAGAPCPTPGCGGAIRRIVQGGRSSFYCPRCQT